MSQLESAYNQWLINKKTFGMPDIAVIIPVGRISCPNPICGHKYILPERELKNGFKKCPKCGFEK